MLLDTLMPTYDFHEAHSVLVKAAPERAYAAIRDITPAEVALLRTLFAIRALPARLISRAFQGTGRADRCSPIGSRSCGRCCAGGSQCLLTSPAASLSWAPSASSGGRRAARPSTSRTLKSSWRSIVRAMRRLR